jgi:hypothetical protein
VLGQEVGGTSQNKSWSNTRKGLTDYFDISHSEKLLEGVAFLFAGWDASIQLFCSCHCRHQHKHPNIFRKIPAGSLSLLNLTSFRNRGGV